MRFTNRRWLNFVLGGAVAFLPAAMSSCAPRPPYRAPLPPATRAPSAPRPSLPSPPPSPETTRRPLPQDSTIKEQDLKPRGSGSPSSNAPGQEDSLTETPTAPESESTPPPLADDSSLLAKITPGVSPQRAASLRLTEEGRKLLDAGDPKRALSRLERTIAIDSTNAYGYFFLAKAHHQLGRYRESLNFLDVAESRLSQEPYWLAEVYALRGEDYRALGMTEKAEASYSRALQLNSGNRTAAEALSRLRAETNSSPH